MLSRCFHFRVSEIFVSSLFLLPFISAKPYCLSVTYEELTGFQEEDHGHGYMHLADFKQRWHAALIKYCQLTLRHYGLHAQFRRLGTPALGELILFCSIQGKVGKGIVKIFQKDFKSRGVWPQISRRNLEDFEERFWRSPPEICGQIKRYFQAFDTQQVTKTRDYCRFCQDFSKFSMGCKPWKAGVFLTFRTAWHPHWPLVTDRAGTAGRHYLPGQ